MVEQEVDIWTRRQNFSALKFQVKIIRSLKYKVNIFETLLEI